LFALPCTGQCQFFWGVFSFKFLNMGITNVMSVKSERTVFSQIIPAGDKRSFLLLGIAAVIWWVAFNNLQALADLLTYDLLGLDAESHLAAR
jgi:hypothetical protein